MDISEYGTRACFRNETYREGPLPGDLPGKCTRHGMYDAEEFRLPSNGELKCAPGRAQPTQSGQGGRAV